MFYLQRSGSPDQEGPYSFEFLLHMAKEGRLFADDTIIPADGGPSFRAAENLEFGDLEYATPPEAPPTFNPKPTGTKVSPGTIAIISAVVVLSLCCIPSFFIFRTGSQAVQGEMSGVESIDSITALNQVTMATLSYCNDHDGFFPSGMDSTLWKEQLRPYLPAGSVLEINKDMQIEANPNLSVIRQGSVIDPRQTLMFFIRKPVLGDQSAVSNVAGDSGYVNSAGLERSIRRDIYNVPFERGNRRGR